MAGLKEVPVLELTRLNELPEGFLDCSARELYKLLPGPTLIELEGRKEPPLFVSILQHGNEDTGLTAMQQVLRNHEGRELPRKLILFVGNVEAAREGRRRLDDQPDYNRAWPGTAAHQDTAEAQVMAKVHQLVVQRKAIAAIDIHNNSGLNPHYGVVCSLDSKSLHLATFFSRMAVWFSGLPGTQTGSFAGHVPAIAVECGQPGILANAQDAARFVEAMLSLSAFPHAPVHHQDIDLFHTMATARVRPEVSISFDHGPADIRFDPQIDHFNFRELGARAVLGETDHPMPLEVLDEEGRDVSAEFFIIEDGKLMLRREAMPAMLKSNERIIRQDCLCYLMERVSAEHIAPHAVD
jgi:hypothetical protein